MSSLKPAHLPYFLPPRPPSHCPPPHPPHPLPPWRPFLPREPPHPQYPGLLIQCSHWQYPPQMWDLLSLNEKERQSTIVCRSKERENYGLIYERERRKSSMLTARAGARSRWGADQTGGGRRGQWGRQATGLCLSPPTSKTKAATGPNSLSVDQYQRKHLLVYWLDGILDCYLAPVELILCFVRDWNTWCHSRRFSMYALCTTISAIAMKYALGFRIETLATNSRAVAFTPTTYSDELSRGLKTSSFSKSMFLMATLSEWWNLMWDGRCKAVHIFSTIESVECTQWFCRECSQLRCAEHTRLMNVPNCAALNVCGW